MPQTSYFLHHLGRLLPDRITQLSEIRHGRRPITSSGRTRCGENAMVPLHGDHHRRNGVLHRRVRSLLHLSRHEVARSNILPCRWVFETRFLAAECVGGCQWCGLLRDPIRPALLRVARR